MNTPLYRLRAPLLLFSSLVLAGPALAQDTVLLSQVGGIQANGRSELPDCSADGRFVVWQTLASNLVPGDSNGTWDVVLLDRQSNTFELVSRTPMGAALNGPSYEPRISADGRFIVFRTIASNLQSGVGAAVWIYDRIAGSHELASPGQTQAVSGTTPRISQDGRYVVFVTGTAASPLDTNGQDDVYRYDRIANTLELASRSSTGAQANRDCRFPSVTADGRYVVFDCWANNGAWGAGLSSFTHVWRKDMQTGAFEVISTAEDGTPANAICATPMVSADGSWVAFETGASNIMVTGGAQQIAAKNLVTGEILPVSVNNSGAIANNYNYGAFVSHDGRFVVFQSTGSNMPGGGTNTYWGVWVRDLAQGITRKISLSSAATGNVTGTENSYPASPSITGRHVLFSSEATNLVAGDVNGSKDIFMRDVFGDAPSTYGWSPEQSIGCLPHIEAAGTPSATAGSGFDVTLQDVRGAQPGMLIYSKVGPGTTQLFGSFLYLAAPVVRTPVQNSGGSSSACNGTLQFDFNAWVASGLDAGLTAGSSVWVQYWSRDPGDLDGAHLSDAVAFVLMP